MNATLRPLTTPDNIEELIEAYMRREIARIHRHNSYAHVTISLAEIHGFPSKIERSCYCGQALGDQKGETLVECVNAQIDRIANHDPLADKRKQIAALEQECAQIEAERGVA